MPAMPGKEDINYNWTVACWANILMAPTETVPPAAAGRRSYLPAAGVALAALSIGVFIFLLARDAFQAGFNLDDLMNLDRALDRGWAGNFLDTLLFFRHSPTYRPVGSLFYEAVHAVAGPSVLAYRLAGFPLVLIDLLLLYYWTKALTSSRETALLVVLLMAFHGEFAMLYFQTGFIYDVLCFFFYYSAFLLYLRVRRDDRALPLHWTLAWCALYILALGSKEMGVSLPVLIGLYELIYHPPTSFRVACLHNWVLRQGRIPLLGGLITAAFLFGRVLNSNALIQVDAYQPQFTLAKYLENTGHFLKLATYGAHWSQSDTAVVATFLVLMLATVKSRARLLGLLILLVAMLPIAFIYHRGLDALWVALPGLALLLASLLVSCSRLIAPRSTVVRPAILFSLTFALLLQVHWPNRIMRERIRSEADVIDRAIADVRELRAVLTPGSRILVLRDSFHQGAAWSTGYIIRIALNARQFDVRRIDTLPVPIRREELLRYHFILTTTKGHLRQVPTDYFRAHCLSDPMACAD